MLKSASRWCRALCLGSSCCKEDKARPVEGPNSSGFLELSPSRCWKDFPSLKAPQDNKAGGVFRNNVTEVPGWLSDDGEFWSPVVETSIRMCYVLRLMVLEIDHLIKYARNKFYLGVVFFASTSAVDVLTKKLQISLTPNLYYLFITMITSL